MFLYFLGHFPTAAVTGYGHVLFEIYFKSVFCNLLKILVGYNKGDCHWLLSSHFTLFKFNWGGGHWLPTHTPKIWIEIEILGVRKQMFCHSVDQNLMAPLQILHVHVTELKTAFEL